jgi:hypothetical protein
VSPNGNDANSGTSASEPFQTLAKLSTLTLNAGDRIYFEAGQTFPGNLILHPGSTDASNPVFINTYPADGQATIVAGAGADGVLLEDFPGIDISHLKVTAPLAGNGRPTNPYSGINVRVVNSSQGVFYTRIHDVEVSGFNKPGIYLNSKRTDAGLINVEVVNADLHHNGSAGLYSDAPYPTIVHYGITLSHVSASYNSGDGNLQDNSGSGIVLSGVEGGLINECEAFENGSYNQATKGGPMGIWCWDARNVTIQYCYSHHNRTTTKDGGGFDIDGGSENCTIQYCYSAYNEGEGYGLFEFGSPLPWRNNTMRFNISYQDGLKFDAGALHLWAENGKTLEHATIYNNTFNGPRGVVFVNNNFSNSRFANNILDCGTTYLGSPANLTLQTNYEGSVNFIHPGFYLPAGSPLNSGGSVLANTDMGNEDFHHRPLNGVYPIGASQAQ